MTGGSPACLPGPRVLRNGTMKATERTLTVSKAQAGLPRLCNSGQSYLITNRDRPTAVLLPIADYEALIETMDLLANPKAMACTIWSQVRSRGWTPRIFVMWCTTRFAFCGRCRRMGERGTPIRQS